MRIDDGMDQNVQETLGHSAPRSSVDLSNS